MKRIIFGMLLIFFLATYGCSDIKKQDTVPASQPTIPPILGQMEKLPISEIIKNADDFYSKQFNNLLATFSIYVAFFGIGTAAIVAIKIFDSYKFAKYEKKLDKLEEAIKYELSNLDAMRVKIDTQEKKLQENIKDNQQKFIKLEKNIIQTSKIAEAHTFNAQGNLNKSQDNYSKAMLDYATAASLYASAKAWKNMANMLNTIIKYTELEDGLPTKPNYWFKVFTGNNIAFGFMGECKPWEERSPGDASMAIDDYTKGISLLQRASSKLSSIKCLSDDGEIRDRLGYTIRSLEVLIKAIKNK